MTARSRQSKPPELKKAFAIGDEVTIRHDISESTHVVTAIIERQYGFMYEVSGYDRGRTSSWHHDFELKRSKSLSE